MKAKAILPSPAAEIVTRDSKRPMRTRTLPFARPDITEAEIAAVTRVMRSGWLTSGPETLKFEEEFGAAVGARFAVAVNSATSALHLGTTEWNLKPGDAVLVPSITFTATAEVVTYSGAVPVIVDVDRSEYMMNPEVLEQFVSRECRVKGGNLVHKKSGAVIRGMIPVHLGGRPAPMKELLAFAKDHQLRSMEDAAHAFPCRYNKRPVGSISETTAFSFYATKNLTTGEGGMLTTNNATLAKRARMMRLHGIKGQTYGRKR
ncbi:MAG: DegT/DnrJ/EryC1/StrS aminotransferase family protein, partial [Spirochaetia bacterium]|nr:DegT/DnrJ/EryC1/StrS aminotransferase family protein [Spirochaetia bacterium]